MGDDRRPASTVQVSDEPWLPEIVRAVLDGAGADGWRLRDEGFWCMVRPPGAVLPEQGWKLHVSATQLAAPLVLARAAQVLVAEGCAFKFARGRRELADLLSNRCERGSGGKFVTVYPADEGQFRRVAAELDRATDGLPGPRILSDRRLRPGSSVYYRYGAFTGWRVLTDDGRYESPLTDPDGAQVADERLPVFRPPSWAVLPFPDPPAADLPAPGDGPAPVLIGGRFRVTGAIRHSYRGGVYRAVDTVTGAAVVLKQARPHVMATVLGTDARDLLRREHRNLRELGPLGLAPVALELVAEADNLFLAQEEVPGSTLRRWVADRMDGEWLGQGPPPGEAVGLARELIGLVAAVHRRGLVLCDLTPNNVMVTPDGRLRLIDLELAVRAGATVVPMATPGYAAPEWGRPPGDGGQQVARAPAPAVDAYGLGATLLHLTGVEPTLLPDEPAHRLRHERLATLVATAAPHLPALRLLQPMILGLLHDDAGHRWTLERASGFLAGARATVRSPAAARRPDPPPAAVDDLVRDGLRYLAGTATQDGPRLWPATREERWSDPCCVGQGAAGVLAVVCQAARTAGGEQPLALAALAVEWIERRLPETPRVLPGLYTGRAGIAWALHDAATLLADDALAQRAVALALGMPTRGPLADVMHGTAGAGLALLHLWSATGEPSLLRHAVEAADSVLAAARERDGELRWPIHATAQSRLAGHSYLGFAHGVAGAGTFLLYAALATGREEYLAAAERAGGTLADVAEVAEGAARWRTGQPGEPALWRHWCHGSAGVGAFLIRLWAATGEPRFRELAEAAGEAAHRGRFGSTVVACHGLAGAGDLLLDLADLTGDQRHRDRAAHVAALVVARHAVRDGLRVFADEGGREVTAGYSTGLPGTLGYLLRATHGGGRLFMPDRLLPERAAEGHDGTPALVAERR